MVKKTPSKLMIEDGGQHGIKVSDGMQQSLGLAWNSKMTISVKTGPIQKHLETCCKTCGFTFVVWLLYNIKCAIFNFLFNYCILYTSWVEREMVAIKNHLLGV